MAEDQPTKGQGAVWGRGRWGLSPAGPGPAQESLPRALAESLDFSRPSKESPLWLSCEATICAKNLPQFPS